MNNAMSNAPLMITWETHPVIPSAASVTCKNRLTVRPHLHRKLRRFLNVIDAADGITGRVSHVIMNGALLMALSMEEDTDNIVPYKPAPSSGYIQKKVE